MELVSLKEKIFGFSCRNNEKRIEEEQFSLEEILEVLSREAKETKASVFHEDKGKISLERLGSQEIEVEETSTRRPDILLYEFMEGFYYVYLRKKDSKKAETGYGIKPSSTKEEPSYGLFAPSGVVVRRVPQNILGNGVLGRAFIFQNYIEILDSLMGNEYTEILTHEVLHILHPEKKELEIRQMTRNYIGTQNTVYH